MGDLEAANYWINLALKKTRNNFTLDLAANIAIYSNQFDLANNYIEELKSLDLLLYLNRKATFLMKQNKPREAWTYQEQACATEYPNFEALVQRLDLMMLLGKKDVESEIQKFEKRFEDSIDIHRALWSKYYLSKGQWEIAENYWKKIWQKDLPTFKEIRKMILDQKIHDVYVSIIDRNEAEKELSASESTSNLPILDVELDGSDLHDK